LLPALTSQLGALVVSNYFAIVNPDIDVIGVEDMEAYKAYDMWRDTQLLQVKESQQQWEDDFAKFRAEDLGNIVTPQNEDAIEDALKKLENDFRSFAEGTYRVAGQTSSVGKKLFHLQQRHVLENEARAVAERLKYADDEQQKDRDEAMVVGTLRTIKEKKVDSAVLVVGQMHLKQIGEILLLARSRFAESPATRRMGDLTPTVRKIVPRNARDSGVATRRVTVRLPLRQPRLSP
jgi:hypothetical protein